MGPLNENDTFDVIWSEFDKMHFVIARSKTDKPLQQDFLK